MTDDKFSRADDEADRVRRRAAAALADAFRRRHPAAQVPRGYVERIEENLLDGVSVDLFCEDFAGAGGHELTRPDANTPPKFYAVYSSAALAVNTFARWKRNINRLVVLDYADFEGLRFEAPCPSGLRGTPPTLDVLL